MIFHTQSPRRGPVPVVDAGEGALTTLTLEQGGPGAVSPASIAIQIPFDQLDPNDSKTLKQLALYLQGIGSAVIGGAFDGSAASNVHITDFPMSGSDGAK